MTACGRSVSCIMYKNNFIGVKYVVSQCKCVTGPVQGTNVD